MPNQKRRKDTGRNILYKIGDFISFYLAIATGQDPTPIPAITALKAELT